MAAISDHAGNAVTHMVDNDTFPFIGMWLYLSLFYSFLKGTQAMMLSHVLVARQRPKRKAA